MVGISLSQGETVAASGAMLLYMTNFLAILLAGGGTLAFLGLGSAATSTLTGFARRRAFYVIGIGVLLVTIPLAATSVKVARESWTQLRVTQGVTIWLEDSTYDVREVDVDGQDISVTIAGEGETPPLSELDAIVVEGTASGSGILELLIVPIEIEQIEMSVES